MLMKRNRHVSANSRMSQLPMRDNQVNRCSAREAGRAMGGGDGAVGISGMAALKW
jgi:hypothetical protein